jgi:hypothetical protein
MARTNTNTISTICTWGFQVGGKVGEAPISLLDTGASVTLFRKDTWERVNAGNTHTLAAWAGQPLVGVDGSPLQVFAKVNMTLKDKRFSTSTLVVSPLTTEAFCSSTMLPLTWGIGGCGQVTKIPLSKPP